MWPRAAPTRRACGSPSARGVFAGDRTGMATFALCARRPCASAVLRRIEKALGDGRVGVDAAVAQERPVAARLFNQRPIDLAEQDLFGIVRGLGDDAAEGIGQKAAAPELEARPGGAIAQNVAVLEAHAVHGRHIDAVGDGVGALDGLPRVDIAPRRTRPSPPGASRWPWDKTAPRRPAAR